MPMQVGRELFCVTCGGVDHTFRVKACCPPCFQPLTVFLDAEQSTDLVRLTTVRYNSTSVWCHRGAGVPGVSSSRVAVFKLVFRCRVVGSQLPGMRAWVRLVGVYVHTGKHEWAPMRVAACIAVICCGARARHCSFDSSAQCHGMQECMRGTLTIVLRERTCRGTIQRCI